MNAAAEKFSDSNQAGVLEPLSRVGMPRPKQEGRSKTGLAKHPEIARTGKIRVSG